MSLFPIVRYAENKDDKDSVKHRRILDKIKTDSQKRGAKLKRATDDPPSHSLKVPKTAEGGSKRDGKTSSAKKVTGKCTNLATEEPCISTKSPSILHDPVNQSVSPPQNSIASSEYMDRSYDPLKQFKTGLRNQKQMVVIGGDIEEGYREVRHKLPEWIENPGYLSPDMHNDGTTDDPLLKCLDERLQRNLNRMGITKLFPVQKSLIPPLLFDTKFGIEKSVYRPHDICVCSPTGSGKTLAFALPIINALLQCSTPATRALVILPTVELANQVQHVFFALARGSRVNCVLLGGNKTLLEETRSLNKIDKYGENIPPDVIVATPGRLVHYLETSVDLDLGKLRFLVIDEADRILNQIKQSWIKKLEEHLEEGKMCQESSMTLQQLYKPAIHVQKLLFSATLSTDPEKLEVLNLFQPRLFTSAPDMQRKPMSAKAPAATKYLTPTGLKEYRIHCSTAQKPLLVINLIKQNPRRILCFVASTESSRRLSLVLEEFAKAEAEDGEGMPPFSSSEFSSLLTKKERNRQLSRFKSGKTNILVCSDAAARGLDVDDVEQVILYDSPRFLETYIHRIGRTSRAGKEGVAYTLVCTTEVRNFKKLFRDGGKNLPQKFTLDCNDQFTKTYKTALSKAQLMLTSEANKP